MSSCNQSFFDDDDRKMTKNYIKKKGTKIKLCKRCDIKFIGDDCPYCSKQ